MFVPILLIGCNITKKVPEGQHLLRKHEFNIQYTQNHQHGKLSDAELEDVVRIRPNRKLFFTRLPLRFYNSINQEKVVRKRREKNAELHAKNLLKLKKEIEKNEKRIERAQKRGDSVYRPYRAKLKDTINPKKIRGEWWSDVAGDMPILLDSTAVKNSSKQLELFLAKKGYYSALVSDTTLYNPKIRLRRRKKQAIVQYHIVLGKPHTIDSVYYEGEDPRIHNIISRYLSRNELLMPGSLFDRDILEDLRLKLARELRNETYYEFSPSHILFTADTTTRSLGVQLGIIIRPRKLRDVSHKDSVQIYPQRLYRVGQVYFHICDTARYNGNFREALLHRGITFDPKNFVPTLDTLVYEPTDLIQANRRKATFLYNGSLPLKHELLEMTNFLEDTYWYRAYYLDRTYNKLLELDIFQTIQPVLVDRPEEGLVDVHYYLVPAKVQTFSFEPRTTNSNGFFGVSTSASYRHKNTFKRGGKFTAAVSVGYQNQPRVIDIGDDNQTQQTIELGPSVKLVLPGLLPINPLKFSKRQYTSTEFSAAVNYQDRSDFRRRLIQFNYLWKWRSDKFQSFQMGLPFISGFKFVNFNTSPTFQQRLDDINDLFLKNAYSNQFIYNDFKLAYTYSNENLNANLATPRRLFLNYDVGLDLAGNLLSWVADTAKDDNGQRRVFGVPFSQFVRIDNDLKLYQKFTKSRILAFRLQAGFGYSYGNSPTNMPFDYAFFSGGSNDNRGWRARELGTGAYQYHRDPNRTITQIGDIRLASSIEFRFNIQGTNRFKGAVFADAGNIWSFRADPSRPGGQFTADFYKQIALSSGLGVRMDLGFLIVRVDVGIPIHNPAMSENGRWIWESRAGFEQELIDAFPDPLDRLKVPRPFMPRLHFGIGYPF